MKVLIVSGIWPPDVGGPASHAPDVADFLLGRGHEVEVVTTADAPPAPRSYPVRAVPRRHRIGVRHYRGAALVHHCARDVDVVWRSFAPLPMNTLVRHPERSEGSHRGISST